MTSRRNPFGKTALRGGMPTILLLAFGLIPGALSAADDAAFVSYSGVPSQMTAGETASVTVTMRNTGTTTWTSSGGYELGSRNPKGNDRWGLSRAALASDAPPDSLVYFKFPITAPMEAGTYRFRWKMQNADGAFGAKTELREIEVMPAPVDGAAFVSYSGVPSQMTAGGTASVTVTMRNTGTTTWTSAGGYELISRNPEGNDRWGLSRAALAADTPPDSLAYFQFTITAPMEAGSHKFRWRMRSAGGAFGEKTELREIEVAASTVDDAAFVSYSDVPSRMTAGETASVTVTMQNTGTTTWTSAGGYELGSRNPVDHDRWGLSRAPLAADAPPDSLASFKLTITAPMEAGRHGFRWRMRSEDGPFGEKTELREIEVVTPLTDDAAFVSYAGVPSRMTAGGTATVTVTMQNTGTTTWTSAGGYELISRNPEGNDRWGLSRAPLTSDAPPDSLAHFKFTITAPMEAGSHKFRWRMRSEDGPFGEKTELREIAVAVPSFGDAEVDDQSWLLHEPIAALELPAATGGDGALEYSLTPSPPPGVALDESTRVLSGTPTELMEATEYTFTVTDVDGDSATLSFSIRVLEEAPSEETADGATFVSYSGLPSRMVAGETATVVVTMMNTGPTTWTSSAGYELVSRSPKYNRKWGLKRVPLVSDVVPGASVNFKFTITAPTEVGTHKFRWRMRSADAWFGEKSELREIVVTGPSFGDEEVEDQEWVKGAPIDSLVLPAATGGDGALRYSLSPSLPPGVTFSALTRRLSGTPTALRETEEYSYTATDRDGDQTTLRFSISVLEEAPPPDGSADDAAFVSYVGVPSNMVPGETATVVVTMRNTGATTWTSAAGYELISRNPVGNDRWGLSRAALASDAPPDSEVYFKFTITAPMEAGTYKFRWRMASAAGGFGEKTPLREIAVAALAPEGPCRADAQTLCLSDSRFQVKVNWWSSGGESGVGKVVQTAGDVSGLFHFFDRRNWEVLIKVLNGCATNGHIWVLGASTTDLGYRITVTDMVAGESRSYENAPGLPASAIMDRKAFAGPCSAAGGR